MIAEILRAEIKKVGFARNLWLKRFFLFNPEFPLGTKRFGTPVDPPLLPSFLL
jgi:hypothetical protein